MPKVMFQEIACCTSRAPHDAFAEEIGTSMLPDNVEEIARRALKGDKDALKELLSEGDALLSASSFEMAANVLKEAAICYRIALFRERANHETVQRHVVELRAEVDYLRSQLLRHWKALQIDIPADKDTSEESIINAYRRSITWTTDIEESRNTLLRLWSDQGVRFSSPGGSVDRKVVGTLKKLFDTLRESPETLHQRFSKEELIAIEPIATAVIEAL